MRLSMWMIANRLKDLDLELHIKDQAPIILTSARLVYATNCAYLYRSENDIICCNDEDYIRIPDIDLNEAFETIQSIFDYYEEWNEVITDAILRQDYQTVIDKSWHVFHNPIILLDNDCKMIAMSKRYLGEHVDEEWDYVAAYGYSSVKSIRYMQSECTKYNFYAPGPHLFHFDKANLSSTLSCPLFYEDSQYGRVNVVQHDREINSGDLQMLSIIVKKLAPSFAQLYSSRDKNSSYNTIASLLTGHNPGQKAIDKFIDFNFHHPISEFKMYLLDTFEEKSDNYTLSLIYSLLSNQIFDCHISIYENQLLLICDSSLDIPSALEKCSFASILKKHILYCGISLPFHNMKNIRIYYKQALFSMDYRTKDSKPYYDFYDYALDYILGSRSITETLRACHPDVYALWFDEKDMELEKIRTLSSYLNNERSLIATAEELHIHRNTLVYRIKKIESKLTYGIGDSYTRDYMKLSIRILKLFNQSKKF